MKTKLNILARALGIPQVLLSLSDRSYALSGYGRDRANYLLVSADFNVAKAFSFGFSYKRGRDAPTFKGTRRMGLTVGVGF